MIIMKQKTQTKIYAISLMILSATFLNGCDKSRAEKSNETKLSNKKVCVSVAGGTYGRAGVRARQYVGKGPKMRVVQWKTPDFQDDLQIVDDKTNYGSAPNIAVQLSWRVNETKTAIESSFESLDAYTLNLNTQQSIDAAYWEITIYDGEKSVLSASKALDGKVRDVFSTESRGLIIPSNIGEALGGVNGGRFQIALLDANKKIIVKREIMPSKGYEFKAAAKTAVDGLSELLKTPDNCTIPTTQLRTQ